MKNKILFYCMMFLLQVLVFNKTFFFNNLILTPIIIIFLLWNHKKNSLFLLNIAFIVGLFIDFFNNSHGIFSLGLTLFVFIRNYWIEFYFVKDKISANVFFTSYEIGIKSFFYYSIPLIVIFESFIYLIEIDSITNLPSYLIKIIFSSFFTFALILLLQLLFFKSNKKYEWR